MSERQRQIEFLKSLIGFGDTEHFRKLEERLHHAQQMEESIRRKIGALVVLALISLAGLGYTAMFVPEAFEFSIPMLAKVFSVLGLASLICLVFFVAHWLWYRVLLNGVLSECRKLVQRFFRAKMFPEKVETAFVPRVETSFISRIK